MPDWLVMFDFIFRKSNIRPFRIAVVFQSDLVMKVLPTSSGCGVSVGGFAIVIGDLKGQMNYG